MKKKIFYIVLTMIISSAVVVALFVSSEHIMKRENPFTRRFLPHPLSPLKRIELPYNSYYIAGVFEDKIYLGNTTAPLHGLVINFKPEIIDTLTLNFSNFHDYSFSSIKWDLVKDTLLLNDHTVSTFLKSTVSDPNLQLWQKTDTIAYSQAIPFSSNKYLLRTYNNKRNNVNLSILNFDRGLMKMEGILDEENQPRDLFSNDGILLYNHELKKTIYVFYYKNKSFVFDNNLQNKQIIRTIDTISKPNFDVIYLAKTQQLKMSENSIMVNKLAATSGKYLYIASDRLGRNENKAMYRQATIIDVYNLLTGTYESSFYFYHYKNKPIKQLYITNRYAVGVGSNFLAIGHFRDSIFD
ncbi:hypothetical protein [Paenimyroides viscosum]|uniref:DUF4221 domain-containing protein n=1 Tax=Paenimyroides viscosum TaxID=2488729 RepID=A0A3P1B1S4_9FLAO|nr:hypothetical protein [Paenimyroides viscosum]RRA94602.1 hypothetical protein EG242_08675 [Paenimyroides viscosum]